MEPDILARMLAEEVASIEESLIFLRRMIAVLEEEKGADDVPCPTWDCQS